LASRGFGRFDRLPNGKRKTMSIKIIAIVVAALAVLVALCGCSATGGAADNGGGQKQQPREVNDKVVVTANKPVIISVLTGKDRGPEDVRGKGSHQPARVCSHCSKALGAGLCTLWTITPLIPPRRFQGYWTGGKR
jgi:hypothetical protein